MGSYDWESSGSGGMGMASRILHLPRGISRLEKIGTVKVFEKNEILVRRGDRPSTCYVVRSGKIVGHEYTEDGEERVYHINEAGSVLLESMVLFNWVSDVEFKVIRRAEVICIPRAALLDAVRKDPEVALDLLQSVSSKFMAAMQELKAVNHFSAEWRICDLLLVYADFYGVDYDGKILIREKISQQIISNLLGINRITTVRAIKNLKDMGLVEQINGLYCIRDLELLKRHQQRLV